MSTDADGGGEAVPDGGGPSVPESALDKDLEDMTRAELRGRIARIVGARTNWDTPLDKKTLNSVFAYYTGEFHTPRRAIFDPDSPDFAERQEILRAVVFGSPVGEPADRWSVADAREPTELRWQELYDLAEDMLEREDKRSWTPGGEE